MHPELEQFVEDIVYPTVRVVSRGKATVEDKTVDAIELINPYGQKVVWGMFGMRRGKFKGTLANDASVEGVSYVVEEYL